MTAHRYRKVRVKATGEVGHIAHMAGAEFQVNTHLREWSFAGAWILMERTGEIRAYLLSSIEDVTG